MKLEDGSGTMKVEAGICIYLSYKVKMLWVLLSTGAFLFHGLIFLSFGYLFRKTVWAVNTKKKVIIWMSFISIALGLTALCAEAYVSPDHSVQLVWNDPCPKLHGWRKAVFLKVMVNKPMEIATTLRAISFEVSCGLVVLQILDKLTHNSPVGWALWASFLSAYLMLGGTSVELYYVSVCSLSLKTTVHSVLSVLSTFSSMLSIHLELVSVDQIQELQKSYLRQKDCKISKLLAQIKRLGSQIKRLSTNIRRLKNRHKDKDYEIRQLEADVGRKETRIAALSLEKSQALEKYNTCKNQSYCLAERSTAANTILSLRASVAEKESKIAELRAAIEAIKGEPKDVKSGNEEEKEKWQEITKSLRAKLEVTESDVVRAEVKLAKMRSQLDSEQSSQSQLVNAKDAELAASRKQISRHESEFASYKVRAHSLLQRKDAELAAARDTEQLTELEEALKVHAPTATHDRVAMEQPKAAAKDAKIYLFEDGDMFEEFAIDQETDGKDEGEEVTQQWEDDWEDDDDDFSLLLRSELESNNNNDMK